MNIGNLIEGRASSDIVSCTVDQTMRDVVALLADRRIGALPVIPAAKRSTRARSKCSEATFTAFGEAAPGATGAAPICA
mgnify:CR=1 FL=1